MLASDSLVPSIRSSLQHGNTLLEESLRFGVLVRFARGHIWRTIDVGLLRVLPLSVQRFNLSPHRYTLSDQFHGVVRVSWDAAQER